MTALPITCQVVSGCVFIWVLLLVRCSHLASLFVEDVPLPPVMCFAMGTLGFLTPVDAAGYRWETHCPAASAWLNASRRACNQAAWNCGDETLADHSHAASVYMSNYPVLVTHAAMNMS